MKLLLFSLLILTVLAVGISQAEAYDGNISITKVNPNPTIGEVAEFTGMLTNVEPTKDTTLQIYLFDTDGSIIDIFQPELDSEMTQLNEFTQAWLFEFEIDTSQYDLLTDTKYMVEARFDDVSDDKRFYVMPSLEQSIVDTANAKLESSSMMTQESEIPEWVRNVFTFWVEKQISDQELISAIEYLIEIKIINVNNPLS